MSVHQQGFKLKEGRFGFRRFGYKEENFYGDSSETSINLNFLWHSRRKGMERWEEAKQESLHGKYKIRKKYSMKTFPELHNKSKKKKQS